MTYRITRESVAMAQPCREYPPDRVHELIPPEGLALREFVALNIKASDIMWGLVYAAGLPDRVLRLSAVDTARRSLELVDSPDPRIAAACDIVERHANGLATDPERKEARIMAHCAWECARKPSHVIAASVAISAASAYATRAAWAAGAEFGTSTRERMLQIATLLRLAEGQ